MKVPPEQTPGPDGTTTFQIQLLRRRFLESVTAILFILVIVALPLSLSRILQTGLHPNHISHICIAVLILVVFLARKRLGRRLLISSILFIFSVLSLAAFLQYGLVSAGFYFAAAAIFVTGVSLGLRGGVICAGIYAVAITIIALLWMTGRLVYPFDVCQYVLLPSVWATLGVAFLITTAVFFVSAVIFFRGLTGLVDTIDRQKLEIEERTRALGNSNRELSKALREIKTLTGLLPICSHCKKIRDDKGGWQQLENYMELHTTVEFTHSLCPECLQELYPEIAARLKAKKEGDKPR